MRGVMKGVDERSYESFLRWRMIGLLKGFMWECVDNRLVGQPRKRWIDSMNDCLKKRFECWAIKEKGVR